ncbi:hypothetical protein LHFGNBLO_003789 [Mesorhizobium sp. AR10]|uniref:hypothetical protein n=1 Tax=Mesorhizobium sp. AR10 TaxID=2865839 RepID=UPI00215FC05C|nr:hypothetical protein [Mesorhizobium sp. AR10]UVK36826.1 hypothetical protein LHFGNBLO_003789 [Mesorhizobium sp. AR10]
MTETYTTYDRPLWDHEHQPDVSQYSGGLSVQGDMGKTGKTAKDKAEENLKRQARGDRHDWRRHLQLDAQGKPSPLPKGYRLAPEWTLTKQQKAARTNSIKKAMAKRGKREPIKVPAYQRGERRAVYAELVKVKDDGRTNCGDPYCFVPTWQTRAWEVELQKALDWFGDAIGGEPERPEEKQARERGEGYKPFLDAHFGNDPEDGWDWDYAVPERGDPDFHHMREWNSPTLPPRFVRAAMEARANAGL